MRGTVAKRLRRLATSITLEGSPDEEFETKNVHQLVPPSWASYQASLLEGYEGPVVTLEWSPLMVATFELVQGCTKRIYKQLKVSYKSK